MAADKVKSKTFTGVGALVMRNVLRQPISFISFFALSVFLEAWQLGVYWAVSEVIAILGYFSDVGLAAALIQKKEQPEKKEIRTTFTIQQIIVFILIAGSLILTPWLQQRFDFGPHGRRLLYALLFGFFTSSLQTIPSVQLERKLAYKKLAFVDLMEQIAFSGLAVLLAWQGFGVQSWIIAVVARSIVGVVLMYILSSWPIGFAFDFQSVKDLFNFGIPYQANSLLAVFKDRLMNVFLWGILGSTGMGILGWAQKWSQLPLRFLMDSVIRVTFPAYSRLQKNKERLCKALNKGAFFINFFVFPALAGMGILMPKVVHLFPQYQKWAQGIVPFWLYLVNFGIGAATTPLVNAFSAVGKIKMNLKLMVMWTGLTWLLVPLLARQMGVTGAALGLMLVSLSSVVAWYLVKKEFGVNLLKIIGLPFLLTTVMTGSLLLIDQILTLSIIEMVVITLSGGLIYLALSILTAKEDLVWFLNSLRELRLSNKN
jgi:O-antigen/teichoic acid export membrane protein